MEKLSAFIKEMRPSEKPKYILKAILQHSRIVYLHLSNKIVNDALDGGGR